MNAPSSDARRLTAAFGAVSAAVGALVFVAPKRAAEEFAWNVSAFVAMTIGAWCLGNAWVVLVAVRNWRWAMNLSLLVYLWAFSLLEVLVLVWFRDKLRTDVLRVAVPPDAGPGLAGRARSHHRRCARLHRPF